MVQRLMASGIDGDRTNCYGETAFYCAAAKGDVEMVRVLMSETVLDEADQRGITPLGMAVFNGHLQVVSLLLRAGADRQKTYGKKSLLEIARQKGYDQIALLLSNDAALGKPRLSIATSSAHALAQKSNHPELSSRASHPERATFSAKAAASAADLAICL